MSLVLSILIPVIVVSATLYLIHRMFPLPTPARQLVSVVLVAMLIVWILQALGVAPPPR